MRLHTCSTNAPNSLEARTPIYGVERRRLRITKLRGVDFRGGYHDFKIQTGGMIDVEAISEGPGRGAKFVVRLPLAVRLSAPGGYDETDLGFRHGCGRSLVSGLRL